ncbi:helix-turn-helix transcriptional regulator [Roseobacteraceae bacterium NS-SX3]
MHTTSPTPEALIGISTLVQMLQRSRASIYRDIQNKAFPKPLKLGKSSRWKLSEVQAVIERLSQDRMND